MVFYLGRERAEVFSALAPVGSTDPIVEVPDLAVALPVLYITGTMDPMNPMEGGDVFIGRRHYGYSRPVEEILGRWAQGLGCSSGVERAFRTGEVHRLYEECDEGGELRYIRLEGHGHHWPGSEAMLPEGMAGPNRAKLDATEVIWEFFAGR